MKADQTGPAVTGALKQLTDDADCQLAMEAAGLLAGRGDPSGLPARAPGQTPSDAEHALCMIRHDGDEARQRKRLAEFIPREGVELIENVIGGPDQEGAGQDSERVTDVDEVAGALEQFFDGQSRAEDGGGLQLEAAKDGRLVLRSITEVRYLGCDC